MTTRIHFSIARFDPQKDTKPFMQDFFLDVEEAKILCFLKLCTC